VDLLTENLTEWLNRHEVRLSPKCFNCQCYASTNFCTNYNKHFSGVFHWCEDWNYNEKINATPLELIIITFNHELFLKTDNPLKRMK